MKRVERTTNLCLDEARQRAKRQIPAIPARAVNIRSDDRMVAIGLEASVRRMIGCRFAAPGPARHRSNIFPFARR